MALCTDESLLSALDGMILSPSGWRGVFTASGNEEDSLPQLSAPHALIAAAAALSFADFLKKRPGGAAPTVIMGRDTRPTGESLLRIMVRAFKSCGFQVQCAGICAAPEIMSIRKHAFCYISASHNPIGHNGFKFGLDDGGVLEGGAACELTEMLKERVRRRGAAAELEGLLPENWTGENTLAAGAEECTHSESVKKAALDSYRAFCDTMIGGEKKDMVLDAIARGLKTRSLGIAADFNGSARAYSIDESYFRSMGLSFYSINEKTIAHAIIPEGASLESCRRLLEDLHKDRPEFILGYMPDCDGDRGNLVVHTGKSARILEAQEVFALSCAAELVQLVWTGELGGGKKAAVAVNGPTSMRIDRIAERFGVSVYRAEVGEANVVNLARHLREQGFLVRILGEGSNGGNITHPSAVRDPLSTLAALVKLLTIREFFEIWREHSGGKSPGADYSLEDIIASLPEFYTTGVAEPEAKLSVVTADHSLLKKKYQDVFARQWKEKSGSLRERWGLFSWEARACIDAEEFRKLDDFSAARSGGLKIVFFDKAGIERAFIWMRGSKTESVFRIIADAEQRELERELIGWQREMVGEADRS